MLKGSYLLLNLKDAVSEVKKDSSSPAILNLARFVGAYYLGQPLLAPKSANEVLPTLFEWPAHEVTVNRYEEVHRSEVASTISESYDQRFTAVLLWSSDRRIEAIHYCDQFEDLVSQTLLRFLADEIANTILLKEFLESIIEDSVNKLVVRDYCFADLPSAYEEGRLLAVSMLEMDALVGTRLTRRLGEALLCEMNAIFAALPLYMYCSEVVPRAPVYLPQCENANEESGQYWRLHVMIHSYLNLLSEANALIGCIDFVCCSFIEHSCQTSSARFTSEHQSTSARFTTANSFFTTGFIQLLLLVLRLTYRDLFAAERCLEKKRAAQAAKKYQQLLVNSNDDSDYSALIRWMKDADGNELAYLTSMFDYFRTLKSSACPVGEFTQQNIPAWTNYLLAKTETALKEGEFDLFSEFDLRSQFHKQQVSEATFARARFIANNWTHKRLPHERNRIAMTLNLQPSYFTYAQRCSSTLFSTKFVSSEGELLKRAAKGQTWHVQGSTTAAARNLLEEIITPRKEAYQQPALTVSSAKLFSNRAGAKLVENQIINDISVLQKRANRIVEYLKSSLEKGTGAEVFETDRSAESGILEDGDTDDGHVGCEESRAESVYSREYANDEVHSLDSSRQPPRPDIERLDLGLLTPQPVVRGVAAKSTDSRSTTSALSSSDTGFSEAIPDWLKLMPSKRIRSFLTLERRENTSSLRSEDRVSEASVSIRWRQDSTKQAEQEEGGGGRRERKFQLVTVRSAKMT